VRLGVLKVVLLRKQVFRYFIFIQHCVRVLLTMKFTNKENEIVYKFLCNNKSNALNEYANI